MFELIQMAVGSLLISSAIAYAWWTRVRVTFLREELFAVRDHLWMKAHRLQCLQDPAYLQARDHLNAEIHLAGFFNLPAIKSIQGLISSEIEPVEKCSNLAMAKAIDKAYERSTDLIAAYMYFQQLSGLRLICWDLFRIMGGELFSGWRRPFERDEAALNSRALEQLRDVDISKSCTA